MAQDQPDTILADIALTPQERAEAERDLETRMFQAAQFRVQQNPARFSKLAQDVADDLRDVLTALETSRMLTHILTSHGVADDKRNVVGKLLWELATKTTALQKLPERLTDLLSVKQGTAQSIGYWIAKNILESSEVRFENFWTTLEKWKKDAMELPQEVRQEKPVYPKAMPPKGAISEKPELFGGEFEIPAPPAPRATQLPTANRQLPTTELERDVPWQPRPITPSTPLGTGNDQRPMISRNVARPGDVARLLDANIIKKPQDAEPKIKGNLVDLSN